MLEMKTETCPKFLRLRHALTALAIGASLWLEACIPLEITRGPEANSPRLVGERFVTDDGVELRVRRWLPEGRAEFIIIATHGMNEHGRAFEWPAGLWRSNGIVTYAFDQRGFGRSPDRGIWPGSENLTRDLTQFTRQVRARHPDLPIFLLGESMGGSVALLTASRRDMVDIQGVIVVAPAVAPWEELPLVPRASLWLAAHTIPWFILTGEGLDLRPTDNIRLWRELSLDEDTIRGTRTDAIYGLVQLMDRTAQVIPKVQIPILVLYGQRDEFVRQWMIDWLAGHLPEGRVELVRYEDGYHWLLRDLKPEKVHGTILKWMTGRGAKQGK